MERFLIRRESSVVHKKRKNHEAIHITAKARARLYPEGIFHEDDGVLFCTTCNIAVDHGRKCVLDKHLQSAAHKQRLLAYNGKQQTLKTALENKTGRKEEREKVCHEWIKACAASNIPLNKTDNNEVRKFLHSRVLNGGSIPHARQLRESYLPDVYEAERSEMKKLIQGQKVAIIVDELSDDEGRFVLDIMAVILDFDSLSPSGRTLTYLLDTHYLTETNNKTVAQAVVKTTTEYKINFEDVLVFNSDNVAYMKKAFQDTLSCLFSNCVHITCHSHIVNLAASDFKKNFKEATEFAKCFRNLFYVPSGRKSRFLNYMKNALNVDIKEVRIPPNPTTKSWSAWFDSAIYHAQYYLLYQEFIDEELDRGRSTACKSLLRLEEMFSDDDFMKQLGAQLMLISEKAPPILVYLYFFQERVPHVTESHNMMEKLLHFLSENALLSADDLESCFGEVYEYSYQEKQEFASLTREAFCNARDKLSKYHHDGAQPAAEFLDQVRIFDPRNLVLLDRRLEIIDHIPGIKTVKSDEWSLYVNVIGPAAVKSLDKHERFDLKLFWKSQRQSLPTLYELASCYCTTTIGSYDVERSFSTYKCLLDSKRRRLETKTIKALHFINWNLIIKSNIEEEEKAEAYRCQIEAHEKEAKKELKPTATHQEMSNTKPHPNPPSKKEMKPTASHREISSTKPHPNPPSKTEAIPRPKVHDEKQFQIPEDAQGIKQQQGRPPKRISKNKRSRHEPNKKLARAEKSQDISNKSMNGAPTLHFGIDASMSSLLNRLEDCNFAEHKQVLIDCILNESIPFKGSGMIDVKDLNGLHGEHPLDEDNYICNFIIDSYLQLLVDTTHPTDVSSEFLEWEKFEKGVGKKPAKELLKGKTKILDQDLVFIPCNRLNSKHWFLLVVLPKEKKVVILDSIPPSLFVKPSHQQAVTKMCSVLKELDPSIDLKEWDFSCNGPGEIVEQKNSFDCGVLVCLYARSLVQKCPLASTATVGNFRKHMLLELHERRLCDPYSDEFEIGCYYAIEYEKSYYIGRVIKCDEGSNYVQLKFMYTVGAKVFDWPTRDDIDTCHRSCVIYGKMKIYGSRPFTFPQLDELDRLYEIIKKSRKQV